MSKLTKHEDSKYFNVSDYKPIITYAGDRDLFLNLETTLCQALPQESTEWVRSFGRVSRSVTLSAVFVPFSEDILQNEENYHLLKQPILHIFWTQCADVETYKSSLHDEIKEWLHVLQEHRIADWLIVLVETYDFRKHNKLLPRTTVLDKIKNDFGAKHADRCLSVINPLKSEFRTGSSWRGLVVNIRLLILSAYDRALLKLEAFIRTQRECRNQADWNFCDYFLLQEELAFALEMLGMYEEALIQYDELDALFMQFIRNSSLTIAPSWLSTFQTPVDSWSSILLTPKVNQTYREAIQEHVISLLDFRCYLFSRQAAMLLFTYKPWEIAQRTLPFIHNCLNEIRILEVKYPEGAISCWIFLCCLEIILMCQNFNDTAQVDACSQYTAPLIELATTKLRELGELCGLMPGSEQSSEQLHTIVNLSSGIHEPFRSTSANNVTPVDKLKEALSSKEAFYKQYLELSEQAMITYKHKGRIRSARFIGKQVADFYLKIGDLAKASGFLVNALAAYEEDNWPALANEIRLKLLHCYEQLNETEKLLRTSISVAASSQLDNQLQLRYFNEAIKIVQENNPSDSQSEWIIPLEEAFVVNNISIEVQQAGLRVHAILEIINRFPADLICSNISISVSSICSNNDKHKKIAELDYKNILIKNLKTKNTLAKLPFAYVLEFQQDKSLAATKIICKNLEAHIKRQDSQKVKNPVLPIKVNATNMLISKSVLLKPGVNYVTLMSKDEETSGTYSLGQLNVNVEEKLYFLTSPSYLSKVRYSVKHVLPTVSVETPGNRMLLAGIESPVNLRISMGTYLLSQNPVLRLRSSNELKFATPDEANAGETQLKNEMEIDLSKNSEQFQNSVDIPLVVRSEFPPQTDGSIIEHKLWLKCPWSEEEVCQVIQFHVPFIVLSRIHTAKLRKFILVTVIGATREAVTLSSPELQVSEKELRVKSLNPASAQPFVVHNRLKIKFMWELISEAFDFRKCRIKFSIVYSAYENTGHYECECGISDFKTLYTVESNVDPSRGCEFCRVNTMCHLTFTVKRVASTPDHSLMYEVVADQNMWAVCNMSTGVIILDETEKCCISVDLMPLISGYLPLPLIKLSKYFPVEGNSSKGMSPRLEPFSHGQVFNANKSTQIQVLPAVNVSEA